MIIGGANGAAQAGSSRAGYSERFLPCVAQVIPQAVRNVFNRTTRKAVVYSASARIRNVADSAWVSLGSASYFQVSLNAFGEISTAELTLQDPETWSAYRIGGDYVALLEPSQRRAQLICGVTIDGTTYETLIFEGIIKSYSETVGVNGGGINLHLEDNRDILSRRSSVSLTPASASLYRAMYNQLASEAISDRPIRSLILNLEDRELDLTLSSGPLSASTAQGVIDGLNPGVSTNSMTASSGLRVAYTGSSDASSDYVFAYSDANIATAQRVMGSRSFNTVQIYYVSAGVGTTGEVSDAADVAKRGRILRASGLIGGPYSTQAEATQDAEDALAYELVGKVNLEVALNPFLRVGAWIQAGSTRYAITTGRARALRIQHQYAVGRAVTYLSELAIQ